MSRRKILGTARRPLAVLVVLALMMAFVPVVAVAASNGTIADTVTEYGVLFREQRAPSQWFYGIGASARTANSSDHGHHMEGANTSDIVFDSTYSTFTLVLSEYATEVAVDFRNLLEGFTPANEGWHVWAAVVEDTSYTLNNLTMDGSSRRATLYYTTAYDGWDDNHIPAYLVVGLGGASTGEPVDRTLAFALSTSSSISVDTLFYVRLTRDGVAEEEVSNMGELENALANAYASPGTIFTITVTDNFDIDDDMTIHANVTLDIAGNDITIDEDVSMAVYGEIVIGDGTLTIRGTLYLSRNPALITVTGTGGIYLVDGGILHNYWLIDGTITVYYGGILTWAAREVVPSYGYILVGDTDGAFFQMHEDAVLVIEANGYGFDSAVLSGGDATVRNVNGRPFVLDFDLAVEENYTLTVASLPEGSLRTTGVTMNIYNNVDLTIDVGGTIELQEFARVILGYGARIIVGDLDYDMGDVTLPNFGILNSVWNVAPRVGGEHFYGDVEAPSITAMVEGGIAVTIDGYYSTALMPQPVRIVVGGAFLVDDAAFAGLNRGDWVADLPEGVTATAARYSASVVTITFDGTPEEYTDGADLLVITIPHGALLWTEYCIPHNVDVDGGGSVSINITPPAPAFDYAAILGTRDAGPGFVQAFTLTIADYGDTSPTTGITSRYLVIQARSPVGTVWIGGISAIDSATFYFYAPAGVTEVIAFLSSSPYASLENRVSTYAVWPAPAS